MRASSSLFRPRAASSPSICPPLPPNLPPPHRTSLTHTPPPPPSTRLPDASVTPETVQADIAAIGTVGAGGIELLGYYQYGLPEAERGVPPPTDWTLYSFGTPAFRAVFRAALQAASDGALVMDFAQGANQGQGVPSVPGTEGLAVELAYANVTVEAGQAWAGVLPLSAQPGNPFSSFMHSLEEFGGQVLRAVQAVEVVGGMWDPRSSAFFALPFFGARLFADGVSCGFSSFGRGCGRGRVLVDAADRRGW